MHSSRPQVRPLLAVLAAGSFALASAPAARAFVASEDFGSYSAPTNFTTAALGSSAGAGAAGTGAAGNGWLNGWRTASTTTTPPVSIANTSPLGSGGNYLTASLNTNSTGSTLDSLSVARAYDVAGGSLATAASIDVAFDFRVTSSASTMRFDLFENQVRGTGATGASYNFRTSGGVWNYFNGVNMVATTLTFSVGAVYSFDISINPVASTYSFTISDGTDSVSASSIGFRTAGFATDATTGSNGGRWVIFNSIETTNVASQSSVIAIDNLSVSTIPEPASAATLAGAALLGVAATRRRRR